MAANIQIISISTALAVVHTGPCQLRGRVSLGEDIHYHRRFENHGGGRKVLAMSEAFANGPSEAVQVAQTVCGVD